MEKFIRFELKNTTKIYTSKVTFIEFIATGCIGFIEKLHSFSLEVIEDFERNCKGDKMFIKEK